MSLENQIRYYTDVLGIQSFVVRPVEPRVRIFFEPSEPGETVEKFKQNSTLVNILKAIGLRNEEVSFSVLEKVDPAVKSPTKEIIFHLKEKSLLSEGGNSIFVPHPKLLERNLALKKDAWAILKTIAVPTS